MRIKYDVQPHTKTGRLKRNRTQQTCMTICVFEKMCSLILKQEGLKEIEPNRLV